MAQSLDAKRTAPIVIAAGVALEGPRWPRPLAFALRRKPAEVWDWAEGLRAPPMEALLDLRALLMKRCDQVDSPACEAAVRMIDELL